jgi:hypothetical protein
MAWKLFEYVTAHRTMSGAAADMYRAISSPREQVSSNIRLFQKAGEKLIEQ